MSCFPDFLPVHLIGYPSCPVYRISFLPSWLGFFPALLTGFPQITCRFYCILDPILLRFYCRVFSPSKYPRQSQDGRVKPSKWGRKSIDLSFKIAEITMNLILEYLICLFSGGYGLNTKCTIKKNHDSSWKHFLGLTSKILYLKPAILAFRRLISLV